MSFDQLIYEGKAKRIFSGSLNADQLRQEFKDSLTALNGQKKGEFAGKGRLNRDISGFLFEQLGAMGIRHHWIRNQDDTSMITLKLKMIPLEVVVRNRVAGSLRQRLGLAEGTALPEPVVEFYYKRDDLGDPLVNDDHIRAVRAASLEEVQGLKKTALNINSFLVPIFAKAGLDLIDFKLEFGKNAQGELVLGDEISPDTCRLWDSKTNEKLDKDRFRRDLGEIDKAYLEVHRRLLKGEMGGLKR